MKLPLGSVLLGTVAGIALVIWVYPVSANAAAFLILLTILCTALIEMVGRSLLSRRK